MKELLVLWCESYGQGLNLANSLANSGGEILDCSVIGKWTQLIINSERINNIDGILLDISQTSNFQKKLIKDINPEVINSFLSLSNQKIMDFVLTIEHDFLGDIFELANKLTNEKLQIVDFRLLRHENPRVILMITGSFADLDKAQLITQNYIAQAGLNLKVNCFSDVSSKVRDLFFFESTSISTNIS